MKRITLAMSMLALLIATGTTHAGPITVDLKGTPPELYSTLPPIGDGDGGIIRSGVRISYDPTSNALRQPDTAEIGGLPNGEIHGGTNGTLRFDFSSQATDLKFDFQLTWDQGVVPTGPAIIAIFNNGDTQISRDPNQDYTYNFFYNASAFDSAELSFSLPFNLADEIDFTITNLEYTAVPEPSTLALLATGLLGFGGRRAFSWKRKRSTTATNVSECSSTPPTRASQQQLI